MKQSPSSTFRRLRPRFLFSFLQVDGSRTWIRPNASGTVRESTIPPEIVSGGEVSLKLNPYSVAVLTREFVSQ